MKRVMFVLVSLLLLVPLNMVWAQGGDEDEPEKWVPPINFSGGGNPSTYVNDLQGTVITPPRLINDFTMPSTNGSDYIYTEHNGKIRLVYFGYMTCPDVCPTTMADLLRAYREIGEPAQNVEVLFITIDPERDSIERMEFFTSAFHEDFIGLRPQTDEQMQALLDNFGVIVEKQEVDSALGYLMDHSASVMMIAPDGRMISQYPYGVSYTEIAHDVEVMMDYMLVSDRLVTTNTDTEVVEHDPDREFRIVIPEGTGTEIMMGNDPGIIPLEINLTLGERDILVLENHDSLDYLVGGIWVAPFETVSKQFFEPQTFVGLCTVTVGRDLVEIIVSAPDS